MFCAHLYLLQVPYSHVCFIKPPILLLQVKGILRELQQAVKANGGYILGSFTYADVAMAVRHPSASKAPM